MYRVISRQYHSTKGVFGFIPKPSKEFQLDKRIIDARAQNSKAYRWVESYRNHAHRVASINPVPFQEPAKTESHLLEYSRYGLSRYDSVDLLGVVNSDTTSALTVEQLEQLLQQIYCGTSSIELAYIENEHEREWLTENYEQLFHSTLATSDKKEIAELLLKSQAFDNFLATKFPTVKRYGGEGAESIMAFYRQLFLCAAEADLSNIVVGMPHRGKLNVLTTLFQTRPVKIFRKFKGLPEFPADAKAMCDIANHFNTSTDININGKTIHLNMLNNPSHLEAVNPVSMGKTRAKQLSLQDGPYQLNPSNSSKVVNIQLHGDAAFVGQGINQECLMMADVPHFDVGGSIHMIVNNQVGFTTPGERGRGTRYASDLAKSIMAPVFHVNGDDPEALTKITKLAFAYQQKFGKDVFIDLNCFRRWGHNELDDPTFTSPLLYNVIHNRSSVPDLYAKKLLESGDLTQSDIDTVVKSHHEFLNSELQSVNSYQPEKSYFERQWSGIQQAGNEITTWDTGVDYSLLNLIAQTSVRCPEDFALHPHLRKHHVEARLRKIAEGNRIDWATAEAMAIGSLMYQGYQVRISGEDIGRGTFSQRHAMFIDQNTNEIYIPLNDLEGGAGGKLELANSILSEEAVLGFEYGMAIDNPNNLVIWEAQFGDFFNGAQIIIDTFLTTGETKWMVCNGLVMLLPHGFDGAASEHSSCRIERFLQMTDSKESTPDGDDVNFEVINPSTPAQYFHALRRQQIRNYRKPLVVVAPKTLLRLSECVSTHAELAPGTFFQTVIGDATVSDPKKIKRVILCSGKHYYNLNNERLASKNGEVAIVRLESLCPFPTQRIQEELAKYSNLREVVWSQEEHRNMGAWSFVQPRFENMCGKRIAYRGRYEGSTIAVGVSSWHAKEAEEVIKSAFQ
ncbi:probable 2-oxoglutarate dehydrogenase E1 component DHKTD1 homolog, mitochondrial [Aedes aegypti]|uniref:Transketolase-like pyrimidine-binding domain-containing protein n=1 Tax=Aedes aegypti TaxID=7159 RepID=A0A1S4FAH9_AEDAE|nr:probable 2-oxoglutarate dehydrogenase E1 component DHKTD1 homolog, mitochondrial [Aedes aegypti]XP_021696253.1 probable 2-oxoglutarate dehydrogenase E1 component DHKTD1 homolog, mitochondrial [Aedes aegypti]